MGKVYIAKGGELYKFGNSENPELRLKQLQTGSPVPLSLVFYFDTAIPKKAETHLKREFAPKHSHGEWFRLTDDDLEEIKRAAAGTSTGAPAAPALPSVAVGEPTPPLFVYGTYLLLFLLLLVPLFNLYEYLRYNNTPPQVVVNGTTRPLQPTVLPVAASAPPAASTALVVAPESPPQSLPVEPTPAELIPINDATAYALGAIPPTAAPALVAAPLPTNTPSDLIAIHIEGQPPLEVTWLMPTAKSFEESAQLAYTAFAERGIPVMPNITPVAPRGLVAP